MQRGAVRLKKIPATLAAIELSPGAATGRPVGRDIAPPEPAPITTGRIGTEMLRGVDVTAAASGRKHRRGWRPSSSNGTKNVKVCLLPLPQGSAYAHAARSGLSP